MQLETALNALYLFLIILQTVINHTAFACAVLFYCWFFFFALRSQQTSLPKGITTTQRFFIWLNPRRRFQTNPVSCENLHGCFTFWCKEAPHALQQQLPPLRSTTCCHLIVLHWIIQISPNVMALLQTLLRTEELSAGTSDWQKHSKKVAEGAEHAEGKFEISKLGGHSSFFSLCWSNAHRLTSF